MLIECSNIKKSFQGIDLLKDISFKVDDHDKIAIIGVNGAGKTTILNILIGEESYDSGDLFKSRDLNDKKKKTNMLWARPWISS